MVKDNSTDEFDQKEIAEDSFAYFFKTGWANNVRLMAVNVLFIICNIPSIVLAYLFAVYFIPYLSPSFHWDSFISVVAEDGNTAVSYQLYFLLVIFFITALLPSLLVCLGPVQAGFAQVYKSILSNTSVSLMGDLKKGIKENWKKSLGATFIGLIVTFILLFAISFYSLLNTNFGVVISSVFKVLFVAFILVQNFVYNLMVFTELKLGQCYKNAILFIFLRFGPCFGLGILVILIYLVAPFLLLMSASYLTLGIFVFLYSFLLISWMQYFMAFYSRKLIDRYVSSSKKDDISPENAIESNSNPEEEI